MKNSKTPSKISSHKASSASSIAMVALLSALIIIIQVVSSYIYPLLPLPLSPTLASIPVIVGSVFLGPKRGAFLGFMMGLVLFIQATITPGVFNWLFTPFMPVPGSHYGSPWAVVVTFLPRILIGIFPYFIYKTLKNKVGLALAGITGSLTNTVFVLGFVALFFGGSVLGKIIAVTIVWNAMIEMLAAAISVAAIIPALEKNHN